MKVQRYKDSDGTAWDIFVSNAQDATFLFKRQFIDYHADRFHDYSLLVYDEGDKLVAVVPANITPQNEIISHQGLTYGNILVSNQAKLNTYIEIAHAILKFLVDAGIKRLNLKMIPAFYNPHATNELEYILFLLEAKLYRRDVAFVIDQENKIACSGNIRRDGNKAQKLGATVRCDDSFELFWNSILVPNLKERFNVAPVHSLEEIVLLKERFNNIKQYNVYLDGVLMAGTTMFITDRVAHCQYISASETGRKNGCLNYLFRVLIDDVLAHIKYFDFGIVNEQNGTYINQGMLFWKESFGGRAQKHDFYIIDTSSYKLISKHLK